MVVLETDVLSEVVSSLLTELEGSLKSSGLWSGMPPSPEAMASQEPFCVDTMSFSEWLQWIYIMRLRAMIEHGSDLPAGGCLTPYAEEAFKHMGKDASQLLDIISRLDQSMS